MNSIPDISLGKEPAPVLAQIQQLFRELGLYQQKLCLSHRGQKYLVQCDDTAFTIYRVNEQCHLPPGRPGWPVCLVTSEVIVDESSPPTLEVDDFYPGLTLPDWLRLITETFQE
jgi:hypothetical protein